MKSQPIKQPNAATFTPEAIVDAVLAGRIRVPTFQRRFRWRWEDVRRLFDSILKGYPIGNLLLWEREAPEEAIRLGAIQISAEAGPAYYVVDGQQRVTSLANALTEQENGENADNRFTLAFDLEKDDFVKWESDAPSHVVPLPVLFDLEKVLQWFAEHPELRPHLQRATQVTKAIRQYTIPAYVVKQREESVLRDIFDRMNNYGRRLSRAEIFSALHGGQSHNGSNVHFSDIAEAVAAETQFGTLDDDTTLRAVLARRGPDVTRDIRKEFEQNSRETRDFGTESEKTAYEKGQQALVRAIQFLQDDAKVPHFGFLPYRYLIVVLTRFFGLFPKPTQRNRTLLRRFFWRAALAGPNVFRGSWTHAMRTLAAQIKRKEESPSVQRLLQLFEPEHARAPDLEHFRLKAAETRVILCALWSLKPRSPITGQPYEVDELATVLESETSAKRAVQSVFPFAPPAKRTWAANRLILLDEAAEEEGASVFKQIAEFDTKVRAAILKSHAMDKSTLHLLENEEIEPFLAQRQKAVKEVVHNFVQTMTEVRFEDTPPLDDLSLDEDEGRDDE